MFLFFFKIILLLFWILTPVFVETRCIASLHVSVFELLPEINQLQYLLFLIFIVITPTSGQYVRN
jgi:hypothetical protein